MRRFLSRGGLAWAVAGILVYACGGDARHFIDKKGQAGEGGEGATATGGSSGSNGTGGRGGTSGTGTSGDAGGPAGDGGTSTGGTSTGGTAGTSGEGGMGGEAGEPEPPPPPGRPGTTLVPGGRWMSSTNYKLFSITGNGSLPVNSSSTNYRLHGGIVGTTQP